ncbi:MotA/TolQ/ExbB proton channel family protein [Halodesulfovibrio aestuarii]|uniref:MotA/TolQ/ExbB proton channel family protein n=1 Tax=Halodesulfovibrio aestuarii TaxID=126333 RepID=A0A8G2CBH5_9BACT|nr:MotA/TolQ/ExbB proton channel family protein [Halodesulfovibrio aestuarii]SHJ56314.1 outer membrane transport energization protein ExbB (TC 2.C.1.1.1) [Halodesulfovibrio aestuarii]
MKLYSLLLEQLTAGGLVLLPILLTGFIMWWIILAKLCKLIQFHNAERSVQELKHNPPPEWHWQYYLAQQFTTLRCEDDTVNHAVMDTLRDACSAQLGKGVTTIAVLAATAPLLGLLGTVIGMISTFTTISEFGAGNARGLAYGISQALITTQCGLLVAIPGYLAVTMLQRRVAKLKYRIDNYLSYINVTFERDTKPLYITSRSNSNG